MKTQIVVLLLVLCGAAQVFAQNARTRPRVVPGNQTQQAPPVNQDSNSKKRMPTLLGGDLDFPNDSRSNSTATQPSINRNPQPQSPPVQTTRPTQPPVLIGKDKSTPPATMPAPTSQPANGGEEVEEDDDGVLRVETNIVTIPVAVIDRNGRAIGGLNQQDFEIFEDGKRQEIAYFGKTDQPFTVVLVLDTSPSTKYKIEEIQDAAISFINQLKPEDRVMVVEFNREINVLIEPTSDRYRLANAIRRANFGDGTSLYDTVDYVFNWRINRIQGRKAIVLFTDGVDTTSEKSSPSINIRDAEESDAPVYTVYYNTYSDQDDSGGGSIINLPPIWRFPFPFPNGRNDPRRQPRQSPRGTSRRDYETGKRYLDELASTTGGRVYDANATRNLDTAFAGIAEELRRQYHIGYYPTDEGQPGQRKQIRVRVNRPNTVVRARDSYIVGENTTASR